MKINKNESTANILTIAKKHGKPCTKLSMANIVMPALDSQGLMAKVFANVVITKEQPTGCFYGSSSSPVLRILGGKLLDNGGMADAYAWDAQTYAKKANKSHPIGFGYGATLESVKWAMEVLNTVAAPTERDLLTKFFIEQPFLRLVFSGEEQRTCLEVTKELYDAGITACVDEWMSVDENGMSDATLLNIGDFLIINECGVYCIRKEEFLGTHSF